MGKLTISVPTLGVKITEDGDQSAVMSKYNLSQEDYEGMANAELGARLAGAVKRAVASGKLPADASKKQVTEFLRDWDGLGGRKGDPITRYKTLSKNPDTPADVLEEARLEAVDFLMNEGEGQPQAPIPSE